MTVTHEEYLKRVSSRTKKLLAVSATALLVSTALAVPALALPGPAGINGEGKNIGIFHNLDFVAAIGYTAGQPMTVEVLRDGVVIGSATGTAVDAEGEGAGLEVNHGPEGTPVAGDCWTETTPDILPGDLIRVTQGDATDEVLVDNIDITQRPTDNKATRDKTDVIVKGHASYADGTPIPIAKLDSGEIRQAEPRFRANPNRVIRTPGTTNGWTAIYRAPYRIFQIKDPLTVQQQKRAILNGDHAMGYGHVDPLPAETQLVEGIGGGGPALGCEASPAARYAVESSNHKTVNLGNVGRDLVLSGTSQDASAVSVKLNDRDPATRPLTATATPSPESGAQTWTVTFPSGTEPGVRGVADLKDGMLTASARYTIAGGTFSGVNLRILKDTIAPSAPKATPRPGVYERARSVVLKTSAANEIHFTQDGSRPTASDREFRRPIRVTATQTIKAIAVDRAGNQSKVASFRYRIR